ncbi:MAG: cell division protein FtsZ [Solirubrobacterales bacterium]
MREGPLSQLFQDTRDGVPGADAPAEPAADQPAPPEVRITDRRGPGAGRGPLTTAGEMDSDARRKPAERLRDVFADNALDRPLYGRDQPVVSSTEPRVATPVLRVVGVGGAGVNAVNRMVAAGITGVEFLAVNTDLQSLQQSAADVTVHIGSELTRGLGAGARPELGREAAMEGYDKIKGLLKGSDMLFIPPGAGGGTGTGAGPVIARIGRELGALTVGIVTKPFGFEGTRRKGQADQGIETLEGEVDTLITIPNDRLLSVLDKQTSMVDAFRVADDVLRQGVQGISDLITLPGLINLDFADVRTTMSEAGPALLGIGMATGESRALEAAQRAVSSPLLETSVQGARSILLSITGGGDLSLMEVSDAARAVQEAAHPDAEIIFGATVDDQLGDQCWVTVVATRFAENGARSARRAPVQTAAPARDERAAPAREPRESREPRPSSPRGPDFGDLDIPEFIPRR